MSKPYGMTTQIFSYVHTDTSTKCAVQKTNNGKAQQLQFHLEILQNLCYCWLRKAPALQDMLLWDLLVSEVTFSCTMNPLQGVCWPAATTIDIQANPLSCMQRIGFYLYTCVVVDRQSPLVVSVQGYLVFLNQDRRRSISNDSGD